VGGISAKELAGEGEGNPVILDRVFPIDASDRGNRFARCGGGPLCLPDRLGSNFCEPDGSLLKPASISSAVSLLSRRLRLPKGAPVSTPSATAIPVICWLTASQNCNPYRSVWGTHPSA